MARIVYGYPSGETIEVALHELAHFLGRAGHGPRLRRGYGDLISRYLSPSDAATFAYAVNFQGHGQ